MKLTDTRPFAKPEAAARHILKLCAEAGSVQDGRIYIERINYPFIFRDKGTAAEYWAGLQLLKERKMILYHESGTYIRILDGNDSLLV
jgi:hypothetical protein